MRMHVQGPVSERKRLTLQPLDLANRRQQAWISEDRPECSSATLHDPTKTHQTAMDCKNTTGHRKIQTKRMLRFKETIEKSWFSRRREILFLSISLLGHFIVSEEVT